MCAFGLSKQASNLSFIPLQLGRKALPFRFPVWLKPLEFTHTLPNGSEVLRPLVGRRTAERENSRRTPWKCLIGSGFQIFDPKNLCKCLFG